MPPRAKTSKTNPAVVVALIGLIGTLVTAIFTSPVLIELIKRSSATPTLASSTSVAPADATLIFAEDFEDGVASGFAFQTGKWQISRDKSNRVLELIATEPEAPAAKAYFGPSTFSDGIIEFRVKFLEPYGMYFDFRQQPDAVYVLSLDVEYSVVLLAVNAEEFVEFDTDSSQPYTILTDVWYTVWLEARGAHVTVKINDNLVLSAYNDRLSEGSIRFALIPNAVIFLDDIKVWSFEQ